MAVYKDLQFGWRVQNDSAIDFRYPAADEAARLAIPVGVLYKGLQVYQQDTDVLYVCVDETENNADSWRSVDQQAYELPLATDTVLGGVKLGDEFETDPGDDLLQLVQVNTSLLTGDPIDRNLLPTNVALTDFANTFTAKQSFDNTDTDFNTRLTINRSSGLFSPHLQLNQTGAGTPGSILFQRNDDNQAQIDTVYNGTEIEVRTFAGNTGSGVAHDPSFTVRTDGVKVGGSETLTEGIVNNIIDIPALPDGNDELQKRVLQITGPIGNPIYEWGVETPPGDDNVQSDWDVTDTSSDAFIRNKPTTITQAQTDKLAGIEAGADVTDKDNVENALGISDAGASNKYLNEQGDFVTVSGGGDSNIVVTSTSVSDGETTFNKYTDADVDSALGISNTGSANNFLTEQGNFSPATITSGYVSGSDIRGVSDLKFDVGHFSLSEVGSDTLHVSLHDDYKVYTAGDGIVFTGSDSDVIDIDLDTNSGLEFDSSKLRIHHGDLSLTSDSTGLKINTGHTNTWNATQIFSADVDFNGDVTFANGEADIENITTASNADTISAGSAAFGSIHQYSTNAITNTIWHNPSTLVNGTDAWHLSVEGRYLQNDDSISGNNDVLSYFDLNIDYGHDTSKDRSWGKIQIGNESLATNSPSSRDAAYIQFDDKRIALTTREGINSPDELLVVEDDGSNYNVSLPQITGGSGMFLAIDSNGLLSAATPSGGGSFNTASNYTVTGNWVFNGEIQLNGDEPTTKANGDVWVESNDVIVYTGGSEVNLSDVSTSVQVLQDVRTDGGHLQRDVNGDIVGTNLINLSSSGNLQIAYDNVDAYRVSAWTNIEAGDRIRITKGDRSQWGVYTANGAGSNALEILSIAGGITLVAGDDVFGDASEADVLIVEIYVDNGDVIGTFTDDDAGLVPAPLASGDENKFLKGDGTWADVDDVSIGTNATEVLSVTDGTISAVDPDLDDGNVRFVIWDQPISGTAELRYAELTGGDGIDIIDTEISVNDGDGIRIHNDTVQVDVKSGGAIERETDGISVRVGDGLEILDDEDDPQHDSIIVNLNGSTLTRSSDGIRINYEGHDFIGNTAWRQMHLRSGVDTTHQDSLITRHDLDQHTTPDVVVHSGAPNTLANLVEDTSSTITWTVNDDDGTSFSGSGERYWYFQPLHEGNNSVSFTDSEDFTRYTNTSSHLADSTNSTVIRVIAENATLNDSSDFDIPTYLSINTLEPVETYIEIRRRPASKVNWGSGTSVDATPTVGTVIFRSEIIDVVNGTYTRDYTMSLVEGQTAKFEKDDMLIVTMVIRSTASSNVVSSPGSFFSFGALDDNDHEWSLEFTTHHYDDIFELEDNGDIRLRINNGDGTFDDRELYDASADRWFGLPEAPTTSGKYELNVASDETTTWVTASGGGGTSYTFQDGGTDVSNQSNVDTINFTGTAVNNVSVDSAEDNILDVRLDRLTYVKFNENTTQRNTVVFNNEFDFFDNAGANTTTISLNRDHDFTGDGHNANEDGDGAWTGDHEFRGNVILPNAGTETEVADGDWLVLDSQDRVRRASLPVTEQFNPREWDYGTISNSHVDTTFQAKNNFQAFKAMNPAEEYNEFEGGENYTYYVSANSNADGYSNGDISRVIRTSGHANSGFQEGFAVKTFHYDSSGNLTHEYLLWLDFNDPVFSEDDFDTLFNNTAAGTRRWTTDDSDNRHPVAAAGGEQIGKISSGDWVGFDLTAFLNNSGHEVQLMGVKRYTYDSNDNLERIEIEGRNPSFV